VSSVYDTDPVGPPQANFLNAVVRADTTLSARGIFERLKDIEREMGRTPAERWGPREIDLDLLLFGSDVIDEADLVVPHPELKNRAFVLVPLVELDPDIRIPSDGTAADQLARVGTFGINPTAHALR
jgi:2-amino-4-hydroxy-6-hydroxymethyldihydropteridine diphosphokinase